MNDFEDRDQLRLLVQIIMDQEGFENFAATRDEGMMCIVMGHDSEPEMDQASKQVINRLGRNTIEYMETYYEISLYEEDGMWHAVDETRECTGETKMEVMEKFFNE